MSAIGLSLYRVCRRRLSGLGLRKYAVVNRVNDWVLRRVKGQTAMVNGHLMHLDPRDSLDLSLNGVYEPFETEIVHRLVHEGDIVLDVGANIGYYTLVLARRVGAGGRVFAFEPDPDNFALLTKNVGTNGYRNVVPVNAALSNRSGTLELHLCDDNRGDHRIYASGADRKTIEVSTIAGDDCLGEISSCVNFIKIDVQGAEGLVLRGLCRTLQRSKGCRVIFEFWPEGMSKAGDNPAEVLDYMSHQGFSFELVDEKRKALLKVERQDVLSEFAIATGNQTNLLASRPK